MGLEAVENTSHTHSRKHRGPIVHLYAQTDSDIQFMDDVEAEIK